MRLLPLVLSALAPHPAPPPASGVAIESNAPAPAVTRRLGTDRPADGRADDDRDYGMDAYGVSGTSDP